MAIASNTEEGCVTLSGQGTRVNTEHFVYDTEENNGLTIHFSGGDYCDEKRDYDLTLNIICSNSKEITDIKVTQTH
jgi:hypothetical protein